MFDAKGDRRGLSQIEQLQDNTEVRVGVYDPRVEDIEWEPSRPIRWQGGSKYGQRILRLKYAWHSWVILNDKSVDVVQIFISL